MGTFAILPSMVRSVPPSSALRDEIAASVLFHGQPWDSLDAVLENATELHFDEGELLIRQGDPPEFLLVLLEGAARAEVADPAQDSTIVGRFGAGDVIGEMALVTEEPRTATIIAESSGRAFQLPSDAFHRVARRYPDLAAVCTNLVAERLGTGARDGLGGKVLEGYRITRVLGRGGMAIVYEAEHVESGKRVALKMLSHRLLYHLGATARFRREADIVQGLDHPGVARLHGRFRAFNTYFLVLEFCAGRTLDALIREEGALGEKRVRTLMGRLAEALRYVHEQGIVHRDLKPSNIMVNENDRPRLMDFGVARPEPDQGVTHTLPGTLLGSPIYMPPEQLSGSEVGPRADLYSLACTAYEALAGRPLFSGTDLMTVIREKAVFELPRREDIGTGISAEMHAFLDRALRFDPAERDLDLATLVAWS